MKRVLLFMLCLMATILAYAQKDLSSNQLKLRTEIVNFLKEEGFAPEIDNDGDIKFKRQGNTCYVIIDEKNTSPMYIRLERYCPISESYSEVTARLAAELLTHRFKAIKCNYITSSKQYRVTGPMFVRSAEPFKEVFYQLCSSMDDLIDEVEEALDEEVAKQNGGGLPLSISKIEIGNVYNDGTIETEYGATIYDDNTMYLKPRITYTGNKSGNVSLKVKFFTADGDLSTSSNSPIGFSYEKSVSLEKGSGKTIVLSGWGGEDKGHWKAGTYRIEIWYENTCLKKQEFLVEEKEDDYKSLLMANVVEGIKEEYGGLPAAVSAGKFNIEINDILADVKSTSIIFVFRMPKSYSVITEEEKRQSLTFCDATVKGANNELKNNQKAMEDAGLEDLHFSYRLEDKLGTYIAGVKK